MSRNFSEEEQAQSFERQNELLVARLEDLQKQKFYGQVTLELCAGNIIQARITESWKLQEEADGVTDNEAQADGCKNQAATAPT